MAGRAGRMLRSGVTAARDCGARGGLDLLLRDAITAGELPGPRLAVSGSPLTIADGHCHYLGGWIPFKRTPAERIAAGDPRPSLEERYVDHDGYVAAVERAIDKAKAAGFLLDAAAERLLLQARLSNVLR